MARSWTDIDDLADLLSPRVLLLCYVSVIAIAVVYAASTSAVAFGAYNSQWDGADELQTLGEETDTHVRISTNTTYYSQSQPNETVALILSPSRGYGTRDQGHVRQFVRNGGTLIVAEDYRHHSNLLLRGIGATARLNGTPIHDTRRYYQSSAFPRVRFTSSHPVGENISTVVFNHGTAVEPGNSTVILNSSNYSYLDTTGNTQLDAEETLRRYPVGTVESVGKGRVFVIGDPSIFINAMLDRGDNRQFAINLIGSQEQLLIDYSHTSGIPPLTGAVLALNRSPLLLTLVGGLFIVVLGLWEKGADLALRRLWQQRQSSNTHPERLSSKSAIQQYLQRRHPEWDQNRIQRITEGIMMRQTNTNDDD